MTVCKFQRSAGVLADRWCAHGWQDGGGLCVFENGKATLNNTNVYANQAYDVCARLLCPLSSRARAEHTCTYSSWQGGGLSVFGPQGTATLINSNIYSNAADQVLLDCVQVPALRWCSG